METITSSRVVIECRGLTKQFGAGTTAVLALRGVDVSVYAGQLTLLVGPSGCGKTTLLSVVTGILDPTQGEVQVLGRNVARMRSSEKSSFRARRIGMVFQGFHLLPALTSAENACVPLVMGGWSRRQAVAEARKLLAELGMPDAAEKAPFELSSGQQQRVAIARALLHRPPLVVCDEPTSALDQETGAGIMQLLRDAAVERDRAVFVVTHDPRLRRFADRVAVMEDGRIVNVECLGN
jgi:putative ABC transport system ATP-binding protein